MPHTEHAAAAHRNNFDAVRLLAALVVLVFHGWPLGDWGQAPRVMGWPIYTVAVFVFFAVSGQLITRSWFRDPRVGAYLLRRGGRILPALTVVVAATAFVIGPIASRLPATQYFAEETTWRYLWNIALVAQYPLPGVFTENPTDAVNGSLWSLGPEVLCYLGVVLLGIMAARTSRGWTTALTAVLALALLVGYSSSAGGGDLRALHITITAMLMFLVGAIYERVRVPRSAAIAIVSVLVMLVVGAIDESAGKLMLIVILPYLTRYVGGGSTPIVRDVARFGDYSYGIYLWGFLVLQGVIAAIPTGSPWAVLAAAIPLTVVAAVASWWLVERPMLACARRLSSRRRRATDGTPAESAGSSQPAVSAQSPQDFG